MHAWRPSAAHPTRRGGRLAAVLTMLGMAAAGAAGADVPPGSVVSQRGRAFSPAALTIKQGDTVRIVNDDGDILHHAYVDADGFSFDSGDQEPGAKADVVFSKAGTYTVLCGIHPRMKLVVTVTP